MADTATRTYNPDRVTVTWGQLEIDGFMDGSVIEAERDEDAVTKKTGLKGNVTRTKNRNRGGSVSLTLMQSSPSNDDLSAAAALDEDTDPGVIQPLMIKDANGSTQVFAAEAWIKKVAKLERGKDLSPAVWVFDCASMAPLIGGQEA